MFKNCIKLINTTEEIEVIEKSLWGVFYLIYNKELKSPDGLMNLLFKEVDFSSTFFNNKALVDNQGIRFCLNRLLGALMNENSNVLKSLFKSGVLQFLDYCLSKELNEAEWFKEVIWCTRIVLSDNQLYVVRALEDTEIFQNVFKLARRYSEVRTLMREVTQFIGDTINYMNLCNAYTIVEIGYLDFTYQILNEFRYSPDSELLLPLVSSLIRILGFGDTNKENGENPLVKRMVETGDIEVILENILIKDIDEKLNEAIQVLITEYFKHSEDLN